MRHILQGTCLKSVLISFFISYNIELHLKSRSLPLKGPIQVAARSKAWACGRSLAGIANSNPVGGWMSVCCECCVLSIWGLCDGLITRPEQFCRVWCVWVWSWSLDNEHSDPLGAVAPLGGDSLIVVKLMLLFHGLSHNFSDFVYLRPEKLF